MEVLEHQQQHQLIHERRTTAPICKEIPASHFMENSMEEPIAISSPKNDSNYNKGKSGSKHGRQESQPSPFLLEVTGYESPKMTRLNFNGITVDSNEKFFSTNSLDESREILRRNFDLLDTNLTGFLDYKTLWLLISKFPQINNIFEISDVSALFSNDEHTLSLDNNLWKKNMISRLVSSFFIKEGSDKLKWTIGFSETFELFLILKRMKNIFEDGTNIPAYQAPNILQEILPRSKHMFIASSISKWMTNYYLEKQIHQGLMGIAKKEIGQFPDQKYTTNQHGVTFFPVLEMVVDILEKGNFKLSE